MVAVFDGHNDALTCDDHGLIVSGTPRWPSRPARGCARGACAVRSLPCSLHVRHDWTPVTRTDGVLEIALAAPVAHAEAAAFATAGGRPAARAGAGRRGADRALGPATLDAARSGDGPPVAVLHLEGAEAIDTELESLELWYAAGLRSLGPCGAAPTTSVMACRSFPVESRHRSGSDRGRVRRSSAAARNSGSSSISAISTRRASGMWRGPTSGPLVASHSGVHALCPASRNLTDAQLDAIGRPRVWSGSSTPAVPAPRLRRRSGHAAGADRPARRVCRRADRGRARRRSARISTAPRFRLRSGDVAGVPRLLDALRDCRVQRPPSSTRSRGTTGAGCSTRGGGAEPAGERNGQSERRAAGRVLRASAAVDHPLDHVLVPAVGAQQPVALCAHAHVGLGRSLRLPMRSTSLQHLDDRPVLGLQPQEGRLAPVDRLPALLAGAKSPRLDRLGQPVVVPRVGQRDLRARVVRQRHPLEEHPFVALERQVGEGDRLFGAELGDHLGDVRVDVGRARGHAPPRCGDARRGRSRSRRSAPGRLAASTRRGASRRRCAPTVSAPVPTSGETGDRNHARGRPSRRWRPAGRPRPPPNAR